VAAVANERWHRTAWSRTMMTRRSGRVRAGALFFFVIIAAFFVARGRSHRSQSTGAGASQSGSTRSDDPNTLSVLAGSELKDLEPLLPDLERATGVKIVFAYSGTLAGIDRLNAGEHFDAAWFSHAKYLVLNDATTNRVKAQEKTMLSPVVLGVKRSVAHRFGWDAKSPTWADIARRAKAGELRDAMTNPTD